MVVKAFIAWIISAILIIVGYIGNVYQVVHSELHMEESTYLVVKIVGMFLPPLGSILGWIGFFQ